MPTSSTFRVRFAIVGIFSALAVAFLLSPGNAQPGRPGFYRPPSVPKPPTFPTPPPIRPPSMPAMPGPTTTVYTWTCEKCRASLGTTTTPNSPYTRCPHCGVIFTGTTITPGGGLNPPPANPGFNPPPGNPGMSAPPPTMPNTGEPGAPPLPVNPAAGGTPTSVRSDSESAPAPPADSAAPSAGPSDSPSSSSSSEQEPKKKGSRALLYIGLFVGVVLLLGALILGFVVMKASQPVKRPRKKKVYELDDDDD